MEYRIDLPLTKDITTKFRCGDMVYLSGEMYTARDAAHKRMIESLDAGQPLPFPIENACLYYVGPTPAPPGQVIGSAGPTTSYRMDAYAPRLLRLGLLGMIGKGKRSPEVVAAMQEAGGVYLGAIGGAGALLSRCITESRVIAYPELGPEALRLLRVENFPTVVIIDSQGDNLYERGRDAWLAAHSED